MRRVGFEPTISVFERAKRVHALDRAVTVFDTRRYITDFFYRLKMGIQEIYYEGVDWIYLAH
jgi:hypothetical protein